MATILLADDEPMARATLRQLLEADPVEGGVVAGHQAAVELFGFFVDRLAAAAGNRIEQLCKELDLPVLISQSFAEAATDCAAALRPVGMHELRDVSGTRMLYTLAEDWPSGELA